MTDNNKTEYVCDGRWIDLSGLSLSILEQMKSRFVNPCVISKEEWEKSNNDR